ncbi:hypothetical protein ECG_02714 [Echinococcus granulosus]|nr:hypothetical protein ECG_02714 [Echinococcus granulosus]
MVRLPTQGIYLPGTVIRVSLIFLIKGDRVKCVCLESERVLKTTLRVEQLPFSRLPTLRFASKCLLTLLQSVRASSKAFFLGPRVLFFQLLLVFWPIA